MASISLEGDVGLRPSAKLLEQLQAALDKDATLTLPTAVSQVLEGHREVLEVEALQWLAKNLATLPGLAEALISSQLLLPKRVTAARNPELEERCVKLRKEQEAREYR